MALLLITTLLALRIYQIYNEADPFKKKPPALGIFVSFSDEMALMSRTL